MEDSEEQKVFTGNYVLSIDGFILIGFFVFSCFMTFKGIEEENSKCFVAIAIWIILFAGLTYRMNYFILTSKKLIVKNPIWLWKKIEFNFEAIEETSIVYPRRKSPICLYVKTKNSTKYFGASSLRNTTWKELKRNLEENKIKVIDKVWGNSTTANSGFAQ